jgi:hypothetical protein
VLDRCDDQLDTLVDVVLLVVPDPPFAASLVVELWVDALLSPLGWVDVDEPVDVVVPADAPGLESVCDEPEAPVVVEAVPVPVGVGVVVPVGL